MKKLIMIAALVLAAPFAYADSEMATDAVVAADASAEATATMAAEAVEVVDKGTEAVIEQQELSQAETAAAAQ
jgi:hypothetical protein